MNVNLIPFLGEKNRLTLLRIMWRVLGGQISRKTGWTLW